MMNDECPFNWREGHQGRLLRDIRKLHNVVVVVAGGGRATVLAMTIIAIVVILLLQL